MNIYGNEFKAINKLFEQEKVEEWDIDEFYVAILSLTGAPVTPKRMVLYPYTITHRDDLDKSSVCVVSERRNLLQLIIVLSGRNFPFTTNR